MPSETVVTPDRRTRKRDRRRDDLLDLAAAIVDDRGVVGLSMAALAEAADYATASLYTYFPSRAALVAALQERALRVLSHVAEDGLVGWDARLVELRSPSSRTQAKVDALSRLWAFADLFLTAPEHHPSEFRLQQELLVAATADDDGATPAVIAAAMAVLDVPRRLVAAAVATGAIAADRGVVNRDGEPVDDSMARTLAWTAAMNGALLLDRLEVGSPVAGAVLGEQVTRALLIGWGAEPALLDEAVVVVAGWKVR